MPSWLAKAPVGLHRSDRHLHELKRLFAAIDEAYSMIAAHYGFRCEGCDDNCCMTRFHHHTYLEYMLLAEGYRRLTESQQRDLMEKAEQVCRRLTASKADDPTPGVMCPLNRHGRCSLYDNRPMICRMHGVPHELHYPGGKILQGPGCAAFERIGGRRSHRPLDRTPFYRQMAQLEGDFRVQTGQSGKIKMTVAEMIVALSTATPEAAP